MLQKAKRFWAKHHKLFVVVFAIKTLIKIGLIVFLFNRCSDDPSDNNIDLGEQYYPVEIGDYITYDLDSITFNDFFIPTKVDTSYWEVKEKYESEFTDDLGRTGYRVERFMRPRGSSTWSLSDVWYVVKTNGTMEKVEENQRYIKLVFPASVGIQWEGNKFIAAVDELEYLEGWEYEIVEKGVSATIGGISYDDVLTVQQTDEETAISKTYAIERYAANVGMVYKELWALESQTGIGDPWPGRAEKGFIIKQWATGSGHE